MTRHLLSLSAVVRCPRLPLPSQSVQSGCGFGSMYNDFGDRCLYYCDIGYRKINGSNERVCQANGAWSGQPLDCQGVSINKAFNGLFNCFSCYRYQNEITIDEMESSLYKNALSQFHGLALGPIVCGVLLTKFPCHLH